MYIRDVISSRNDGLWVFSFNTFPLFFITIGSTPPLLVSSRAMLKYDVLFNFSLHLKCYLS